MRLAYMGTPDFAVPALDALIRAGHEVAAVYTQPPRPAGRGKKPRPTPVQAFAEERGLEVRYPVSLKKAPEQQAFAALGLDVAVVAAYGLILPKAILDAPDKGCLNIHGSLLPRWRGAAPIQRALLAGDTETGITIMQMDEGLDTGDMLLREAVPITGETNASTLHDQLAAMGARLIVQALEALGHDALKPVKQDDELATYAHKLSREDGHIDWHRPATDLARKVRALTPWPGAWFPLGEEIVKLHAATAAPSPKTGTAPGTLLDTDMLVACGDGALRLEKIQRPGRAPMTGSECNRGLRLEVGQLLS